MFINPQTLETENSMNQWLTNYKEQHSDQLEHDPDFALWLEESYIPIAGGWLY